MTIPRFARIKEFIIGQIEQGFLLPGDQVPSENQLLEQFGVSRMTARRALQELSDEQILVRAQGLGTFVADARPMSSLLEIKNIADEIRARGHNYHCELILLDAITASGQQAMDLSLAEGSTVFRSVLLHCENGLPLQYEDRLVNPVLAPDYLHQDFLLQTPNAYLSEVAPLTEADHIVEAVCVEESIALALEIDGSQPCLKVSRRTCSKRGVVSFASLFYPGNRYRLGGHLNF